MFFRRVGGAVLATGATARFIRYRSLPPDDPFGEKSGWKDPSDGIYSAVSGVDEAGFAAAAESDEVRDAHFGPEWARFTTIGRVSIKKMNESPAPDAVHKAQTSLSNGLTPEEQRHQNQLDRKRELMKNNYSSYEEFALHHLGGGEEADDAGESQSSDLYTSAEMESVFFSKVENVYGKDRMVQRSAERGELETQEALGDGDLGTPDFMKTADTSSPSPQPLKSGEETDEQIPMEFRQRVLASLGRHGISTVPLSDPLQWDTDHIVNFLTAFESRAEGEESCMDSSMKDAFFLAKADGEMLLNVVTPPRLFRVLRRWHSARKSAVYQAWQQHKAGKEDFSEISTAAVTKLDSIAQQVDPIIIKETILLCFPYGH